jgi:hypothetical protein
MAENKLVLLLMLVPVILLALAVALPLLLEFRKRPNGLCPQCGNKLEPVTEERVRRAAVVFKQEVSVLLMFYYLFGMDNGTCDNCHKQFRMR